MRAFVRALAETADASREFRGHKTVDQNRRIRPPGALPESDFLASCTPESCTACIDACPCDAIVQVPDSFPDAKTPVIVPSLRACASCLDVSCTHVCDTGALRPIESPEKIAMGLAVLDESTCFAFNGTFCVTCYNICPVTPKAIRLNERGRPEVVEEPCTGCGICEERCPTEPRAIRIAPPQPPPLTDGHPPI
jgi:ferredoxin-type protein NapG